MAEIERGVRVTGGAHAHICPYCGCKTLDWGWLVPGKYVGVFCLVCSLCGVLKRDEAEEEE